MKNLEYHQRHRYSKKKRKCMQTRVSSELVQCCLSRGSKLMLNPFKLWTFKGDLSIELVEVLNELILFSLESHFLSLILVCRMGAKWQRIRSILNPRMLKPKHVSSYANTINEVVTDFMERVAWLRETSGEGVMVNDLAGELYKFAFEGQQRASRWNVSTVETLFFLEFWKHLD